MNFLSCYCHLALLSVRDSTASPALFPACPLAKTTLPFLPHTPADRIHPIAGHTTPHLTEPTCTLQPFITAHKRAIFQSQTNPTGGQQTQ